MSLEVELDRAAELDSVLLETSLAQTGAKLSLGALADGDVWKAVSESPEDADVVRQAGVVGHHRDGPSQRPAALRVSLSTGVSS